MAAVSSFFPTRRLARRRRRRRRSSRRRRAIRVLPENPRVRDDQPISTAAVARARSRSASRRRARTCGTARRRARRSRCARRRRASSSRRRSSRRCTPSPAGPPSGRLLVAQIARGAAGPPTALRSCRSSTSSPPPSSPTWRARRRRGRRPSRSRLVAGAGHARRRRADVRGCCGARTALAVAQPLRLPRRCRCRRRGGRQPRPLQVEAARPVRRRAQFGAIRIATRRNSAQFSDGSPPPQTSLQAHAAVRPPRRAVGAVEALVQPAVRAAGERLPHYGTDPQAPRSAKATRRSVPLVGVWVAGTADAAAPSRGRRRASLRCAIRGVR